MKKSQMTTLDLAVAMIIIMVVFSLFVVATTRYIKNLDRDKKVDTYILYENLMININDNSTYNGKSILFINRSIVNMTRLDAFGNISHIDPNGFKRYFLYGSEVPDMYDISMFVLNSSYDYINISGHRFAYGNVSNSTNYRVNILNDSQKMILSGIQPCQYYDESFSIVKPIYVNHSYLNLYFLFCRVNK